jgi:hypothetical protein
VKILVGCGFPCSQSGELFGQPGMAASLSSVSLGDGSAEVAVRDEKKKKAHTRHPH